MVMLTILMGACSQPDPKSNFTIENAITQAFFEKKEQSTDGEIVFVLYDIEIDHIEISDDETSAEIWFAMLDPQTKIREATEPGVALAFLRSKKT